MWERRTCLSFTLSLTFCFSVSMASLELWRKFSWGSGCKMRGWWRSLVVSEHPLSSTQRQMTAGKKKKKNGAAVTARGYIQEVKKKGIKDDNSSPGIFTWESPHPSYTGTRDPGWRHNMTVKTCLSFLVVLQICGVFLHLFGVVLCLYCWSVIVSLASLCPSVAMWLTSTHAKQEPSGLICNPFVLERDDENDVAEGQMDGTASRCVRQKASVYVNAHGQVHAFDCIHDHSCLLLASSHSLSFSLFRPCSIVCQWASLHASCMLFLFNHPARVLSSFGGSWSWYVASFSPNYSKLT